MTRNIPVVFAVVSGVVALSTIETRDHGYSSSSPTVIVPTQLAENASNGSVAASICDSLFSCADVRERQDFLNKWIGEPLRNEYYSVLPPQIELNDENCPLLLEELLDSVGYASANPDVGTEICFAVKN